MLILRAKAYPCFITTAPWVLHTPFFSHCGNSLTYVKSQQILAHLPQNPVFTIYTFTSQSKASCLSAPIFKTNRSFRPFHQPFHVHDSPWEYEGKRLRSLKAERMLEIFSLPSSSYFLKTVHNSLRKKQEWNEILFSLKTKSQQLIIWNSTCFKIMPLSWNLNVNDLITHNFVSSASIVYSSYEIAHL